jgi:hypothetical protein
MGQFEELTAEFEEGAREEQIDDDIAIEGGSELAKNTTCPISGKLVRRQQIDVVRGREPPAPE